MLMIGRPVQFTIEDVNMVFQSSLSSGPGGKLSVDPDIECENKIGDVNCDGRITPVDALEIYLRYIAGLPLEHCFAQP